MKEMLNYIEFVEKLASEGKDEVFFNSGAEHAAIVMSRIFKYSTNEIRIFCGGFNGAVSNDEEYLKHAESFLQRGGRIVILAEEDLSKGQSRIFKLLKKYPENVEMYVTSLKVRMKDQPIHFAIGDSKMLRIETGISDYTAQVNFGNVAEATSFIDLFDNSLLPKSKERNLRLSLA
jgi:hypothetical protein